MKKNWSTPGLVVLVRGRPEERVLAVCKGNNPNATTYGATDLYRKCADGNKSANCNACTGEGGASAS